MAAVVVVQGMLHGLLGAGAHDGGALGGHGVGHEAAAGQREHLRVSGLLLDLPRADEAGHLSLSVLRDVNVLVGAHSLLHGNIDQLEAWLRGLGSPCVGVLALFNIGHGPGYFVFSKCFSDVS